MIGIKEISQITAVMADIVIRYQLSLIFSRKLVDGGKIAMSEVSPSHSSGYWSTSSAEEQQEEVEEESTQKQLDRFVWSQVQEIVQAFGPYGRLLSRKEEYPAHNAVYEQGIPHRVWLRIQTSTMQSFQQWIQRRFGETKLEPDQELRVGEFLLARYALDGFLYRAKVEEVDIVEGEVVVMVRFVDYGNFGDGLTREDLAPWSPYLSRIPPQVENIHICQHFLWLHVISLASPCQAHLCRLRGIPNSCDHLLTIEEYTAFASVMRSAGKMRISVHCKVKNVLEVSLYTRQGEDVLQLVRGNPCLQDYLHGSDSVEPAPPVPDAERQPPLEVSKLVECKVASWLQTVDRWVGGGEGQVSDAEERREFLSLEKVKAFFSFSTIQRSRSMNPGGNGLGMTGWKIMP